MNNKLFEYLKISNNDVANYKVRFLTSNGKEEPLDIYEQKGNIEKWISWKYNNDDLNREKVIVFVRNYKISKNSWLFIGIYDVSKKNNFDQLMSCPAYNISLNKETEDLVGNFTIAYENQSQNMIRKLEEVASYISATEPNEVNDRMKLINKINIGDMFTRDQLMDMFKISGQSGMMKTNLLNMLVLITSEENGIYDDSGIENGTIIYTGEGQIGDETITKNNKTLYYSKESNTPVYLFSKDKKRRYTFEGRVELYDKPYQSTENDINGNLRKVWKFPLKVIYSDAEVKDDEVSKISYEILEIENKMKLNDIDDLKIDESPLKIRKYRKKDVERKLARIKKPDYIAEELIKSKQGEINEKDIYEKELKRLMQIIAEEQVEKMKNFFENRKDNEGYDILSFELDSEGNFIEKYIEVKSTKGGESTPIDITDNEFEFAKKHTDQYYLYRIFNCDSSNRTVKIVKGKDLIENYKFVPITYKIYSN